MANRKEKQGDKRRASPPIASSISKVRGVVETSDASSHVTSTIPEPTPPTDDQIFYLRMLVRHLCSRKHFKTATVADSAEIKGNQKQRENKTQAFLNRYTWGGRAHGDYHAFRKGVLKLYHAHKKGGIELFDDPIMHQAFALVFPNFSSNDPHDDSFIDDALQNWFSIDLQRSRDVCRHHSGLWWIIRPSTTRTKSGVEAEFNLALLNIPPGEVSNNPLPLFKFHQMTGGASGGGEVTSQGRLLAFDSDQILLLGKRRGTQTLTQLSWKYAWGPDRKKHENLIQGAIFTANTYGVLIQSYFHGCFIDGSEQLRGSDFDDVEGLLRSFLGIKIEAEMADVPTSISEVRLLRELQPDLDGPPMGISALKGQTPSHRPVISAAGLERLKAWRQEGPILTII